MKNQLIIVAIIIAAILGGFALFSNKQNERSSSSNNSSKTSGTQAQNVSTTNQDESVSENAIYGHVHALIMNPSDNSLLLGTHDGLFKSVDQGKTFQKIETKGDVNAMDFMNFVYDPNTKTLFAGGHDLGVIKSMDGGITWSKADSGIKGADIHALAMNPLDTTKLYAFSVGNGVFGSKDGAKSWYRIDDGPDNPSTRAFGYMGTPSSMDRGMKTDKTTNIGYLWAGTGGGLYSSFACFCGWTKTTGISDNATIYTLAPDPANRSSMLAGTKDGIFKTTDEGKTFTQVNSNIKNVAAITFDESNPKTIYAATSDGLLYRSVDGGQKWDKVNGISKACLLLSQNVGFLSLVGIASILG
ncbi:hypothetical protein HY025_04705 [Candidatus Daviesbacteria bacterium]|nr:hypothetical protein [Candidatus Daviesbacteria bacterium]